MDEARWTAALAHRERLLRIARARLSSPDDAEDVVQEALLRCVEFERLDLARIGPFLTSVTVRLCADTHRRADERGRARRALGPLLSDAADPADAVCAEGNSRWLATLVAALPERQRRVLVDRALGMSIPQISSRNDLTYKSTESALSRARATLRAAVAGTMGAALVLGRRARTPAVAAASVVAVAVTGAVLTRPQPDRAPDRPPAEAAFAPAAPAPATAPAPTRPGPRPARSPRPTPGPTTPAVDAVVARPGAAEPVPLPTFSVSRGRFTVERHEDGYGPVERLGHCVKYGVSIDPVIACRYPEQGDPP